MVLYNKLLVILHSTVIYIYILQINLIPLIFYNFRNITFIVGIYSQLLLFSEIIATGLIFQQFDFLNSTEKYRNYISVIIDIT